jgi:hypothetical protein
MSRRQAALVVVVTPDERKAIQSASRDLGAALSLTVRDWIEEAAELLPPETLAGPRAPRMRWRTAKRQVMIRLSLDEKKRFARVARQLRTTVQAMGRRALLELVKEAKELESWQRG